jgi:hypothetical protein
MVCAGRTAGAMGNKIARTNESRRKFGTINTHETGLRCA